MAGAVMNAVPGIDAVCGGACACATCVILVDTAWTGLLDPPSETEQYLLEFAVDDATAETRLSCQIIVSDDLDGLCVRVPQAQR